MPDSRLVGLLAQEKGYLWALQHAFAPDREAARAALAEAGIDEGTLLALKRLEPGVARVPQPVTAKPDGLFVQAPVPFTNDIFFQALVTQLGAEASIEIFPQEIEWTFPHRETQMCIGGRVPIDAILPHGERQQVRCIPGDVMAVPAGTRLHFHASEDATPRAHLFQGCLGAHEPRIFYDSVAHLRLQQLGLLAGAPDAASLPPLVDVSDRLAVRDWADLVSPRAGRSQQLPTWLRNGWKNRELTRALDYGEGTKQVVVNAPDREPADFIEWEHGAARCWVNPLIAEHTCAVTDCRLPAGYFRGQPFTEIWTILRGQASIRLTLGPPPYRDTDLIHVDGTTILVVPGGCRVKVEDASDDLVVRRLAETCAHNGHWAMMERKLVADGVDRAHG